MELRKINTDDAFAQWEYTAALPADENGLTNPFHGVSYEEYKEKVLPRLISYEHPVDMPVGKQWQQWMTLFFWAPKSLQMVIAAMKLKDAYSLEGKL